MNMESHDMITAIFVIVSLHFALAIIGYLVRSYDLQRGWHAVMDLIHEFDKVNCNRRDIQFEEIKQRLAEIEERLG